MQFQFQKLSSTLFWKFPVQIFQSFSVFRFFPDLQLLPTSRLIGISKGVVVISAVIEKKGCMKLKLCLPLIHLLADFLIAFYDRWWKKGKYESEAVCCTNVFSLSN